MEIYYNKLNTQMVSELRGVGGLVNAINNLEVFDPVRFQLVYEQADSDKLRKMLVETLIGKVSEVFTVAGLSQRNERGERTAWDWLIKCAFKLDVWAREEFGQLLLCLAKDGDNAMRRQAKEHYAKIIKTAAGKKLIALPKQETYKDKRVPTLDRMAGALEGVITKETLASLQTQYKLERGQINTLDSDNVAVVRYAEGDSTGVHQLDKIFYVAGVHALSWLLDVPFHTKVASVLGSIIGKYKNDGEGKLGYSRGPPKSTARMGTKITDYMNKPFPRAACLIDALRGTICVETPKEVLDAFEIIKKNFQLCRVKGKYTPDEAYHNVMVNVVYEYNELCIIAEVQITTLKSLEIKTLQHKFYDILRTFSGGKTAAQSYATIVKDVCK